MTPLENYRQHILGAIAEMSDETLAKHLENAKMVLDAGLVDVDRQRRAYMRLSLMNDEMAIRENAALFDEWGLPVEPA